MRSIRNICFLFSFIALSIVTFGWSNLFSVKVISSSDNYLAAVAPLEFTQQARLTTTPPSDSFGDAVAVNGDTAVVRGADGFYVFVRSGNVWSQQAVLVPSDVPLAFGGLPVALDGDTLVIGGGYATINSNNSQGAAYVFVRNGTTWSEQQRLTASDGAASDAFGNSVAISGQTIIVGAAQNDVGPIVDQGSAYVFTRSGLVWTEQAILLAADGDTRNYFGHRVAIDGETAVISRFRGNNTATIDPAVYVFNRDGTTWQQQQKISVCEPSGVGGTQCDFGSSLSIDNDTIAVGNDFLNNGNNQAAGGVYVFVRSGTNWSQQKRLLFPDGLAQYYFGKSVAVSDNTLLIGTPGDLFSGTSGSAYIYTRTGTDWVQQQKLFVSATRTGFGASVSMSGSTLLIGSPLDAGSSGSFVGAAYIFTRPVAVVIRSPFDFDGDGKTDISIFRPPVGEWWISRSSSNQTLAAQFGSSSDKITPADFTGDGKSDIAVFRPSTGEWFVLRSEDSSFYSFPFGASGDIPVPADYDGDGKADPAVFRPSAATWFISQTTGGTAIVQFGASGDVPVAADYDGDGRSDIAIFRPSNGQWWLNRTSTGVVAVTFGVGTDKPVTGDFTGDGKSDIAFWRGSTGEWFVLRSEDSSYFSFPFGASGDIPAPGDFDGDGRTDAAVYRNGVWYQLQSTNGVVIQQFGLATDKPVPSAFVP